MPRLRRYRPASAKPPPCAASIDRSRPGAAGQVGLWPLAEGSGLPANAVTGQVAAANAMVWATSSRGPVLSGTSSLPVKYAQTTVANGSPLSLTGKAMSFGAWGYPLTSGSYQCLMMKGAATRQYGVFFSGAGTGNIFVALSGITAGLNIAVSPGWTVGAWNHVLVTYDGANIRVYVNGRQAGSSAQTAAVTEVSGSDLWFGNETASQSNPLNGSLDLPAVWNRTLTAAEAWDLYLNPWRAFAAARPAWQPARAAAAGVARHNLTLLGCGQ